MSDTIVQTITAKKLKATHEKPVYMMVDPVVAKGKDLWPWRDDVEGIEVLLCHQVRDGERFEEQTRSSTLLRIDTAAGTYETLNSIYQLAK